MDSLEQYLNTATRWLFGWRKQKVRTELEGNIQESAIEYQLRGYSPDEGLAAALQEFGNAKKIGLEMMEVHTMPFVYKSGVVMGAVLGAVLLAVTSGAAPLAVTTLAPLPECGTVPIDSLNSVIRCAFSGRWLKLSELKLELEAKGGGLVYQNQEVRLRFVGDNNEVRFSVKNPAPIILPTALPETEFYIYTSFERDKETFVSVFLTVAKIVEQTNQPVRLRGWNNPVLRVGQTEITLGSEQNNFVGVYLYTIGLGDALRKLLPDRGIDTKTGRIPGLTYYDAQEKSRASYLYEQHRIPLETEDGVYAVLLQDPSNGRFLYTIGQSQNKILETYLPSEKVVFTKAFSDILGQATKLEQKALVLRLTGNLNGETYQIIQPKQKESNRIAR